MDTEHNIRNPRRGMKLVLLLIALALLGWFLYSFRVFGSRGFQAVFLSNGQVYFGKLSFEGSQFQVLKDVYYLQVTQPIQPGHANSAADINLVKLGGELHGPTDEMRINRDSISFIEAMRSDSQVVKTINQLEKK